MDNWRKISPKTLLWTIGGAGLLLVFWPDNWSLEWFTQLPSVIHSISHAFIIASILGFTVDRITKERLVKETAKDLIEYLIGWKLPREAQRHIRAVILNEVIRYNFEMRCNLVPLPASSIPRMRIDIELSYLLRNFSNYPKPYSPYIGHEDHESPIFHSLSVHRGQNTEYFYSSDDRGKKLVVHEGKGYTFIRGDEVMVTSSPLEEEQEPFRVIAKYSLILPDDYLFIEPLSSPTIHLTLHVNTPTGYETRIACSKVPRETKGEYFDIPEMFVHGEYIGIQWAPKNQIIIRASSSNDQI